MDGYLRIKTKLDSTELTKKINDTKKELAKLRNDTERLNNKKLSIEAKLNLDDAEYKKKLDEINQKKEVEIKTKSVNGRIDDTTLSRINSKYDLQVGSLGNKMEMSIMKADDELKRIEDQISKNNEKQKTLNSSIDEMNKKLADSNNSNELSENIDGLGTSITNTIKKVAKLTLALFGIRSAYNAIRSSASILSQYNEQIGIDLEYIKFALASTLQPIIERLINLVYRFLSYVNYLAQAWFGINLFANATVDNFNKIDKSAKKAKKTMSTFGFDDLNILQDNNSSSSEDSEIKTPSFDLSKGIEEIEPPEWLKGIENIGKWIIDHHKEIITAIALVGAALLGIKLISWIADTKNAKSSTTDLAKGFKSFFESLGKGLEALSVLGGVALVIHEVCDLIETFSESGLSLGEVAGLLGIVLGELSLAFVALAASTKLMDWTGIAGAAVILGGLAIVLHEVTELIKAFSESGMETNEVTSMMTDILLVLIGLITSLTVAAQLLQSPMAMAGVAVLVAGICATLITLAATLPIILDALSEFITTTAPSIQSILTTIGLLIKNIIEQLGVSLPPIINSVGSLFSSIFSGISKVINSVGNTLVNILNSIGDLVDNVLGSMLDFIRELGPAIEVFVDSAIRSITKLINFMISGIEYLVNLLVIDGINAIIDGINKIGTYVGFTIPNVKEFTIRRFTPTYMAGGGIINLPNKGVPLASNVVGGERGAEGVLPLENYSTMERLGEEIGKHITINLDITNDIDGRVLSRKLEAIKANQQFARNGG